ncbi:hypothetical protein D3C81_1771770 [compost metagenome]
MYRFIFIVAKARSSAAKTISIKSYALAFALLLIAIFRSSLASTSIFFRVSGCLLTTAPFTISPMLCPNNPLPIPTQRYGSTLITPCPSGIVLISMRPAATTIKLINENTIYLPGLIDFMARVLLIDKNVLNTQVEKPGDFKGQKNRGIISPVF